MRNGNNADVAFLKTSKWFYASVVLVWLPMF